MTIRKAQFSIGDVVHHRLFDYIGVVFDVDPEFSLSEEWYDQVAQSRPPKDAPWYHVLVNGQTETTYVAERNLEQAENPKPIDHPLIEEMFAAYRNGRYEVRGHVN